MVVCIWFRVLSLVVCAWYRAQVVNCVAGMECMLFVCWLRMCDET